MLRSVTADASPSRVDSLCVSGYAVAFHKRLPRAGDWLGCPEPFCPNRALLFPLYASVTEARAAVPRLARAKALKILPRAPELIIPELEYQIVEVNSAALRGRDYRSSGCSIQGAFAQLTLGSRLDPAWVEIIGQREEFGANAALLASRDAALGILFVFQSAMPEMTFDHVETVGPPFDVSASDPAVGM